MKTGIEAVVNRAPHPSSRTPDTIAAFKKQSK